MLYLLFIHYYNLLKKTHDLILPHNIPIVILVYIIIIIIYWFFFSFCIIIVYYIKIVLL